ncbi:Lipocalin-like domain-containing protein [Candidatus Ornithobacterium hominis]|uniref:hypothetical protein n=1 Tax=Candidatus Ornithobacterium hominis TaxID=2497989 RepID=UPI0024BD3A62|nr:hypothetical protein [Candidatus Ornithobacterium hominis]CAI9429887.1 Lipocalin-like domain-containing protein [Candidatus Ornithobacterium hominis]
MKKTLKLVAFCLMLGTSFTAITSCNNDDGIEEVVKNKYTYSPPAWIHGEWKIVTSDEEEDDSYGLAFNEKDIFYINKVDIDNKFCRALFSGIVSQEDKNAEKIDNKNKTYQISRRDNEIIIKFEFHLNENGILEFQIEYPTLEVEGNIIHKKEKRTYKRSEKPFNIKYLS